MLTREALLAPPPSIVVDVPEFGGQVRVRALTAGDVWRWQDAHADEARRITGEPAAILVQAAAVDEAHGRLFGVEDIPAIMRWPVAALNRVALAVLTLSGLDAKSQEDRAGN